MVIKSSFKDYYDFVANKFGGGDPRIVYARGPLTKEAFKIVTMKNNRLMDLLPRWHNSEDGMSRMYLVIAGKAYLIAKRNAISLLPDENTNGYRLQPLVDPEEEKKPSWRRRNYGIEFGKEYPFLIEMSKLVNAPVFAVAKIDYERHDLSTIHVVGRCPLLSEIGLPALIDPYQMYQNIAYFMGNTIKPSPDTRPPVALSNRERIVKAGFDLVKSFRHRMNK